MIFGMMFLTFVMTRLLPGNPFHYAFEQSESEIAMYDAAVEGYGLNDPIIVQFYNYYTRLLGLFWAWLIFAYIGGSIGFYVYRGIRVGFDKIHIMKYPKKIATENCVITK